MALERRQGAILKGSMRFWRLRQAKPREVRPISEYYQWWQEHGGEPPPYIIAFVNSGSGNQGVSRAIKNQLLALLEHRFEESGGAQVYLAGSVCELAEVRENPNHVRDTIKRIKRFISARSLRFLVCGGDGTVTWVLQEIEACKNDSPELFAADEPDPPIGIVPAGTGNDLARSLGWGPKLQRVVDLVGYVQWVLSGDVVQLDQWRVRLSFRQQPGELPPGFRPAEPTPFGPFDYEGYFQNYFSVGMDAAVTFGVERARRSWCGRLCFIVGCGKVCYGCQAWRTGACRCCCAPTLSIKDNCVQLMHGTATVRQELGEVRQLTLLNINSYGSGRVPFSVEELAKVAPADGRLELFTVASAAQFGCIMAERSTPGVLAQPEQVSFDLEAGEYVQMDGEAWRLEEGCHVDVRQNRRVQMLRPPTCPSGIWRGRQVPGFWHASRR